MPAFVAALLGGLLSIAGTVAGRVLLQLGFGIITYAGMDTTLSWLKSQAVGYLQSVGTVGGVQIVALLSYMKVGVAISIVFSALVARVALAGFVNGTKKVLSL